MLPKPKPTTNRPVKNTKIQFSSDADFKLLIAAAAKLSKRSAAIFIEDAAAEKARLVIARAVGWPV